MTTSHAPRSALKRAMKVFGRRASHEADDLRNAVDDVRPDALLVDVASWGAMATAEAWGGPWASWCPYPLPLRSRDAPPFGPGLRPARGALHGAGRRPRADRVRLARAHRAAARRRGARAGGARPIAGAEDVFLAPPLLLYLTAEPFEYRAPIGRRACGWWDLATGTRRPRHRPGSTTRRHRSCS